MLKFLFLDDEKIRHELFDNFVHKFNDIEVTHTHNYKDTIKQLEKENFDLICLDHDLGLQADKIPYTDWETYIENIDKQVGTGAKVAEWLAKNLNGEFVNVVIHSWNPVGTENMLNILNSFNVVSYPFGTHLFSFLDHYIPTLREG